MGLLACRLGDLLLLLTHVLTEGSLKTVKRGKKIDALEAVNDCREEIQQTFGVDLMEVD